MTSKLDEELERLSKAADQEDDDVRYYGGPTSTHRPARDAYHAALVQLHRTGQLVPAQPSEPDHYPLRACVWKRQPYDGCSEGEWVLEIEGQINDTSFVTRHTEPLATPPEEVPGLPSLYPAQPSGDVVEAVARTVAEYQIGVGLPSDDAWEDAHGIATAAITTYKAVSGVAKMREALVDDPNWIAAGIPDEAIEAGVAAWDAANEDMQSPSPKADWDEGMIVAAIFKAVARAALGEKP